MRSPRRIMTAEGRLTTLIRRLQALPRYEAMQWDTRAPAGPASQVEFIGSFRPVHDGPFYLADDVRDLIADIERADDGPKPDIYKRLP